MFQKMMMFAASLASRGLGNKKTDIQTKQLRVLSCFDNIIKLKPETLTAELVHDFIYNGKPTYLNLRRN